MSDELKDTSGVPENEGRAESQEVQSPTLSESKKDSVAYDTYRKLLSEKKKNDSRLKDFETELNSLREEKMLGEGKKDELIEHLRKELSKEQSAKKEAITNYAYKSVSSQVMNEAAKMGCVDSDALIRLADLQTLDVDEQFMVNQEQVKMMLESVKEARPYLFQKSVPSVKDGTPKTPELEKENKMSGMDAKSIAYNLAYVHKHGKLPE